MAASGRPALATGVADMDGRLGHGGIATDAVHDVAAASPSLSDDAAATLFVAGLAARLTRVREGGVPVVILRRWRKAASCPLAEPSAAVTRWRIGSAPSALLGMPGVGRTCWQGELVRQRGGEPFSLVLEACDGEGRLALSAAARDRAAAQERAVARAA